MLLFISILIIHSVYRLSTLYVYRSSTLYVYRSSTLYVYRSSTFVKTLSSCLIKDVSLISIVLILSSCLIKDVSLISIALILSSCLIKDVSLISIRIVDKHRIDFVELNIYAIPHYRSFSYDRLLDFETRNKYYRQSAINGELLTIDDPVFKDHWKEYHSWADKWACDCKKEDKTKWCYCDSNKSSAKCSQW
jgi:hypothetical protein